MFTARIASANVMKSERKGAQEERDCIAPSASKALPGFLNGLISMTLIAIWLVFFQNTISVQLNMSQSDNGRLPLAKRTIRSRISSERWEQIKVTYVSGVGLREIARKMNIPQGTVLAHAKRHGWTQQIQVATGLQSDAINPVQSVPQALAAILSERKERTKLGLSKFTAEAAEEAAEHRDKLGIAGRVKDVADVHKTLWPNQPETNHILNLGVLIGNIRPEPPERIESDQA